MSFTNIETSFVQEYSANVQMMAQRKGKLRDYVTIEAGVTGERHYFELYDKTDTISEVTTRHGDINLQDTNFKRVAVDMTDYEDARIVGGFDKLKMLADPMSPVVMAQATSFGRQIDDLIINSIYADIKTGKSGTSTEAAQAAIAVNSWAYGTGSGNANMTISKIIEAMTAFDNADVDMDDRVLVLDPVNHSKLLATAEATSSDFVTGRNLETGEVDGLCGFKLVKHTGVGTDTSGYKRCFAMQKSGIALAIGMDVKADITQRKDKSGQPYQVYHAMSMAATRLEQAKTIEIKCLAS